MPDSTSRVRRLVGLLVLLGFVIVVEVYVGWRRLLAPWLAVPAGPMLVAVVLVLASYGLRALRLCAYFRPRMRGRLVLALRLMLHHNLFNNLLPMRSGEVAFPLLMARYFDIGAGESVPALLWLRLLDLHTIGLIALWSLGRVWLAPAALFLALAAFASLPWWGYRINALLLTRLRRAGTGGRRLRRVALQALVGAPGSARQLAGVWFWTLVNWVVKLGAFAWVLALFARIGVPAALPGVIGGELTSVLPIHAVAGAGTYEAGVLAALVPLGVDAREALAAAVNLHLFLLGVALLGSLLGLGLGRMRTVAA